MLNRVFEIVYPGDDGVTPITERLTSEDILTQFWERWYNKMVSKYGEIYKLNDKWTTLKLIEMCIEDWITIHWALEIFNWDVE